MWWFLPSFLWRLESHPGQCAGVAGHAHRFLLLLWQQELPHSFSLSPLTNTSLQLLACSTSYSQTPKAGSIGDPRERGGGDHTAGAAARLCRQSYRSRFLGFTISCADRSREAGREVVVITSVVKRSQVNQGIDEPSLLIFNASQLQEVGKKEVLNDCFRTGITYVHVQFQRADPYIMHWILLCLSSTSLCKLLCLQLQGLAPIEMVYSAFSS